MYSDLKRNRVERELQMNCVEFDEVYNEEKENQANRNWRQRSKHKEHNKQIEHNECNILNITKFHIKKGQPIKYF